MTAKYEDHLPHGSISLLTDISETRYTWLKIQDSLHLIVSKGKVVLSHLQVKDVDLILHMQ